MRHGYIKPSATLASQAHRLRSERAARAKAAAGAAGGWKMAKFLSTAPRVTAYMGKGPAPAAEGEEQEQLGAACGDDLW